MGRSRPTLRGRTGDEYPHGSLALADAHSVPYATMLLARDQSGDGEKARELLKAALLTARKLGMRALEEQITATL